MRSLFVLFVLLAGTSAFKTNRTSCFQYVSCLDAIQKNFKSCAGGTAISLTLEGKDVNIRDLVKYRALEFVGCQDRLLKEVVDFEALQELVNEDARECFDKLPESSKRIEPFTDSCDYMEPQPRNMSTKGDSLQCLIEYKQNREYCESLLECCPDHTRCGERMNAVSLAYQNARVKAEQIVYSMISCIVSNDPRFLREGARLQSLRDPYRNAGVPFLRPDAYTEARITRRLALTSTSTLAQRRERFLKKYSQIRQVVAQKLVDRYTTTTPSSVEDVITEVSETSNDEVKKLDAETEIMKKEEVVENNEEIKKEELIDVLSTTLATTVDDSNNSDETSDGKVQKIRNLIRTASDKDLSQFVALISQGKFAELFALAEKKEKSEATSAKLDSRLSAKMGKLKEIITKALTDKSSETDEIIDDAKAIETRSSEKDENEKVETEEAKESGNEEKTTAIPTVFTISESSENQIKEKKQLAEAKLAHTIVERPSRNAEDAELDKETTSDSEVEHHDVVRSIPEEKTSKTVDSDEPEAKELTAKERALLVESEIKNSAVESKKLEIVKEVKKDDSSLETPIIVDDVPKLEDLEKKEIEKQSEGKDVLSQMVEEMKEKIETSTPVAPQVTETIKSELIANLDEVLPLKESTTPSDIEGSGEEEEISTTTSQPTTTAEARDLIAQVKQIRPRVEHTHCQEYAQCWQTLIDYEQQCDRKYSTDVLSHGIDDAEILSILQNSSISHHEIVLKACLRPLDRSVHSTLKQLLVIQRGVRKACLDLGRNKIAVTDVEEALCNSEIPSTASVDEFFSSVHVRSQANHMTCRAKLEPIREACSIVRNCCASVETCDNYIASSPVKKLETEAVRRLVKKQNDCETKMLQTLTYIHEQLSSPSRRRRFYYH